MKKVASFLEAEFQSLYGVKGHQLYHERTRYLGRFSFLVRVVIDLS